MSPLWIGRRMQVGLSKEAVRGVGVSPTYWLNCNSFSFQDKPTRALSEASFGGIWGGDQAPMTMSHAEGSFEVELSDQTFGLLLLGLFGADSVSTVDTTGKQHSYTLQNNNQHQSLTITTLDPIGNLVYELGMINSFEMNVALNKIITAKVDFMSKSSATADTTNFTASYGAERKFVGRMLGFKVAANTGALGAATNVQLRALTLKIEKNTELAQVLSTVQPVDIVNRRFNISGEIELNYQDRTYLNYVTAGGYKAVRISLTHDDLAGSTSTKYSFTLDLSKVEFEAFTPSFALDDLVTQKLTFTALYDAGTNNNVVNSCLLVNQVASY